VISDLIKVPSGMRSPRKLRVGGRIRQYGHGRDLQKRKTMAIDDYLENFAMVDSQIGAIFLINGKVVGMDCFGKSGTFEKRLKRL
jgi:hypothetical protein